MILRDSVYMLKNRRCVKTDKKGNKHDITKCEPTAHKNIKGLWEFCFTTILQN